MSEPWRLVGALTDLLFGLVSSARLAMMACISQERPVAPSAGKSGKLLPLAGVLVLLVFAHPLTWAQQDSHDGHAGMDMPAESQQHSHDEHAGMSMPMSMPKDQPTEAMLLAWKRESEGNHHLIGFFLVLSGLFILAQGTVGKRYPALAYVWPSCFLLSGLFVLVYSDTELWPFGPKPWIQGTITNPEVIQHKIFAVLLLGVGLLELGRVRGSLRAVWVAWVFPVLAVFGSLLLLFHSHHSGMRGPNHMAVMARIQAEHLSYAVTGFAIGLVKGLSEVSTRWQIVFARLWPMLMVVLGVLLMFYAE
jgi:putative copper resistance protein D